MNIKKVTGSESESEIDRAVAELRTCQAGECGQPATVLLDGLGPTSGKAAGRHPMTSACWEHAGDALSTLARAKGAADPVEAIFAEARRFRILDKLSDWCLEAGIPAEAFPTTTVAELAHKLDAARAASAPPAGPAVCAQEGCDAPPALKLKILVEGGIPVRACAEHAAWVAGALADVSRGHARAKARRDRELARKGGES